MTGQHAAAADEFTDEFFARPAPDPAMFGLPAEDDGTRDNRLLSTDSAAVISYRPDVDVLRAVPARIVVGVGEETGDTYTAPTARALAARLGQDAVVFPSHHGGFVGGDSEYAGKPAEFAARLREVL